MLFCMMLCHSYNHIISYKEETMRGLERDSLSRYHQQARWFLIIFPWFQDFFYKSLVTLASKCSWKKRSSHQGKKKVACIVSKPLVSCLWACGESVNPQKLNIREVLGALTSLDQRETQARYPFFRIFYFGQIKPLHQKLNPPTFGTFFIQVDAPFETIRYCGFEWWNNRVQCLFPKWFWMVGQLIQNLVWIFPNGSTAINKKPCLDTFKWWNNGPSKTIWMDLNGRTACYQHCSNGITMCVQNQWAFLKVEIFNGFKWSINRRVNTPSKLHIKVGPFG